MYYQAGPRKAQVTAFWDSPSEGNKKIYLLTLLLVKSSSLRELISFSNLQLPKRVLSISRISANREGSSRVKGGRCEVWSEGLSGFTCMELVSHCSGGWAGTNGQNSQRQVRPRGSDVAHVWPNDLLIWPYLLPPSNSLIPLILTLIFLKHTS